MWILIEQSGHDKAEIRKTGRLMAAKRNEKDLLIGEASGGVSFFDTNTKSLLFILSQIFNVLSGLNILP